jgi:hypothetical protein
VHTGLDTFYVQLELEQKWFDLYSGKLIVVPFTVL